MPFLKFIVTSLKFIVTQLKSIVMLQEWLFSVVVY